MKNPKNEFGSLEHSGKIKADDYLAPPVDESHAEVLRELVGHLRQKRTELREEWVRRITATRLLKAMTEDEILAECSAVYDNYLGTLETGSLEALGAYARDL